MTELHRRVRLTFPPGPATEPVVFEIITRFGVVPNIRRAAIADHSGWLVCDLGGEESAVADAIAWMESIGVAVSAVEGDIVEG